MTTIYICFSGLEGAAALWLAIANGRLAVPCARWRNWAKLASRTVVTLLEGVIDAAGDGSLPVVTGLPQGQGPHRRPGGLVSIE